MAPPLLQLQNIQLTFGGTPLITSAELILAAGERVCLVGRNGSGKSTLLKIIAGDVEPDGGSVFRSPGATIRYLPQEPNLAGYETVLDYAVGGLAPGDDPFKAEQLLMELGLPADKSTAHLSGGEARRAALARTLAPEPDILLLDEPTNHLDLPAIEWLEQILLRLNSAQVIISHDRRFLETLTTATVWLDRGETRRLSAGFGQFEAWRDEVLEQEERDRHKLDRKIAMEEDWVRYGVTARRKRNQGRLARLAELRQVRKDARKGPGLIKAEASEGATSGKQVIETKSISKSFDGRAVVSDFSTRILRGDRIALVGRNGAGKTTLLKLLIGELEPDEGSVKLGEGLQIQTLDQRRDALNEEMSVADFLTEGRGDNVTVGGQSRHVVSYLKDFLFQPEQARTPIKTLSGGERGRLLLARALAAPSNLLVLDEPTNDLDLETLDLLQEILTDYQGTLLLVSHDRDFLDRTVSGIFMAEENGRFTEYAGGYRDMLAQRGSGVEAKKDEAQKRKEKSPARSNKPAGRSKLTYKDQHALDTLPGRMAELEELIVSLEAKLAEPDLFAKDRAAFDKASTQLSAAQEELSASEERWLELEMLREEVEGA